jgi:YidC/Oxa1 family membrane protein insertase
MDRNTIIGLGLIGIILVGYSIFTKPAREAQLAERKRLDSIARVEQVRALEAVQQQKEQLSDQSGQETEQDTSSMEQLANELGDFKAGAVGTAEKVILENDQLKIAFSTLGGRPYTVQLKEYHTYD